MALGIIDTSILTSIANAIRTKLGVQTTYKPSEMASAIGQISSGITPTGTKQISITSNGTTTEDVTAYANAEVVVNVPTGITPTGTKEITTNGTYDVTQFASAEVSVPTGITPTGTKQISISTNGTTTEDVTDYANAQITVNVPVGQTVYYTANGVSYAKELELPCLWQGLGGLFEGASELEEVVCNDNRLIGGSTGTKIISYFRNCTKLKTVNFPYIQGIKNGYAENFLGGCTALENATFGSIGYPISEFANTTYTQKVFSGTTQNTLTITLYVDAQSIADIPTAVTAPAPWGATGATIVYKNYLTGAVLT